MEYLEEEKRHFDKWLGASATSEEYKRSAAHVQKFLLTEFKVRKYALHRLDSVFLEKYFQYSIIIILFIFRMVMSSCNSNSTNMQSPNVVVHLMNELFTIYGMMNSDTKSINFCMYC